MSHNSGHPQGRISRISDEFGIEFMGGDKYALMTEDVFSGLDEYSCSLPTYPSVGRIWKRSKYYFREDQRTKPDQCWFMGEALADGEIRWRTILTFDTLTEQHLFTVFSAPRFETNIEEDYAVFKVGRKLTT